MLQHPYIYVNLASVSEAQNAKVFYDIIYCYFVVNIENASLASNSVNTFYESFALI